MIELRELLETITSNECLTIHLPEGLSATGTAKKLLENDLVEDYFDSNVESIEFLAIIDVILITVEE